MGDGLTPQEASMKQLKSLLEAQGRLRRVAEERAREAVAALEYVAEGLAPGEVSRFREQSPAGISVLEPRQIGDLALRAARRRIRRLEAAAVVDPDALEGLRERVAELEQQLREAKRSKPEPSMPSRSTAPRSRPSREETKKATPPVSSSSCGRPDWMALPKPAPVRPVVPTHAWPGWAQRWRDESGNYTRDVDVIVILGDTGMVRRSDVGMILSEWWEVTPKSGGINRALRRVKETELVEAIPSQREKARHPEHLLRLTERGRDAYRLIRGQDAAPSITTELLKRHKSPEDAIFNLETAIALWKARYSVELLPDRVVLDIGVYYPDLVATAEGRSLYVECERGKQRSHEEREQEWFLYYTASGGHFAIATPNERTMETVREEVLMWAGERSLTLWMAIFDETEDAPIEWLDQS